ncbi:copper resistance CopC family protein [Acrocarpospora catenulata]|uniref:copper resistance CopC family protein n=1 Tax=Acrocarpospora catenulata TaxID=2836182 RepID=UPI001BD92FDF|nr:copper resistance protein CopC [Acrocarpospora catenulata]
MPRFIRNSVMAAIAGGLFLALSAPAAYAHDRLKSSNPAKDEKVSSLETIELEYTSKIRFPVVALLQDDQKLPLGKPKLDGDTVRVEVTEPLSAGKYVIAWRVVSIDGHPIEGEIPFTVKESPTPSPSPSPSPSLEEASPSPSGPGTAGAGTEVPSAASTPSLSAVGADDETSQGGGVPGWLWVGGGVLVVVGAGVWLGTARKNTTDES